MTDREPAGAALADVAARRLLVPDETAVAVSPAWFATMSGSAPKADRNRLRLAPFYVRQPEGKGVVDQSELQQLVDAARAGDPEAFGAVFDHCYPAIYRYAYARLGRVADAEDAAAEAFASALAALPRFRWQGKPFESWLFRIAGSKITDSLRRTARDSRPIPAFRDEAGELDDPAQLVVGVERRRLLLLAVERLPRDQRDVVLLRFFADRSLVDVAQAMGRSVGAIKQLQLRALVRLRQLVDE